jgi:integrase/recombinase XerD
VELGADWMRQKIDEFIQGFTGKSPSTQRTYRYVLERFADWLQEAGTDLDGYARMDIQQYVDALLSQGKRAASVRKVFFAIRAFSVASGNQEAVTDIRLPQAPNVLQIAPDSLDRVERNRLMRELDRTGKRRDIAIVWLLIYTGLRVNELVSLNRSDLVISERKGSIRVVGKGNKERVIPLAPEARRAIQMYLEERHDPNPALVLSNRGGRISVRRVQNMLQRYGVHPHQLRHTFITGLVREGEDMAVVQSLSGHASADMVMRYSRPTEEDRQRAVDHLFLDK